jgi:hypothetical protein
MALVLSTDDDAGVHGAVGPVCGDDATVMALQKRADILEFHGFSSCTYPRMSDKSIGLACPHCIPGYADDTIIWS